MKHTAEGYYDAHRVLNCYVFTVITPIKQHKVKTKPGFVTFHDLRPEIGAHPILTSSEPAWGLSEAIL